MTVAEFIVETQWTLLLLIILLPLIIGMIVNKEFRAAILNRRLSVSTSGIEMEPTAATAALATATATDEEVAAAISEEEGEPAKPEEVTAVRREAIEDLLAEAAGYGFHMGGKGSWSMSVPAIDWEAEGGPRISYTGTNSRGLQRVIVQEPGLYRRKPPQRHRENVPRDPGPPPGSPTP